MLLFKKSCYGYRVFYSDCLAIYIYFSRSFSSESNVHNVHSNIHCGWDIYCTGKGRVIFWHACDAQKSVYSMALWEENTDDLSHTHAHTNIHTLSFKVTWELQKAQPRLVMLERPPGGATMRWPERRGMLSSVWAPKNIEILKKIYTYCNVIYKLIYFSMWIFFSTLERVISSKIWPHLTW